MRKKRKQAGKAAEAQAIAVELECPEIVEALEAREVARELADQPGADGAAADAAEPADEAAWADEVEAMEASAAGEGEGPADADADADAAPVVTELSPERLESIIESLLFAGDRPVSLRDFRSLTGERNLGKIEAALAVITERFAARGIVLHDVAGGFQFRTHPANSEYVQRLIAGRPVRLSRAQLETLAIVAYRQPITRPEIDEIRGVDSGSTLKILLDRDLIRILGKKEEPGRPLLYGTTKEFLEFFHLKDLREMPTLREFHELSEDSLREVDRHDQERDDEGAGAADDSDRSASSVESSTIDQTGEPYEAEPAGTATVALDATLGDDLDDAGDAS